MRDALLDNGLRVLIQEVHTAPIASVWCWYRVGSKDEAPGLTGVSHWVEHMNFKGTENIPRDKVKGIIEQFGGYWNGYTWIDQTTYTETATKDALDRMLFIEAERMARSVYDPDDCESERTVIISELKGGENDPDQLLDQEVTASAFRAHPYRHPTIGWLTDLQAMTREDLYRHYRRHYVPNNATLVIVGDVDTTDALRLVAKHFEPIGPGDVARPPLPQEPEQIGERRVLVEREGTTGYVKIAFRAPSVEQPLFFPLLVLDAVLTGAKGLNIWSSFKTPPPQRRARLYRALVDAGHASSVQGALAATQAPFLYSISVTATAGRPLADVEGVALAELERVRRDGISPEELARARHQLRARLVFEDDSVSSRAHQLGYFETIANWRLAQSLDQRIAEVTLDQVGAAAAACLAPWRRTVGWFSPTA